MFRSASPSDLDLLLSASQIDPVSLINADRYRRELALDQYRLEWGWIHYVGDRLLARALWWGRPGSAHPISLDCLWVDPSVPDPQSWRAVCSVPGTRRSAPRECAGCPM